MINTITGTGGADSVFGSSGEDYIHGGAGNDFIFGAAGDDTIEGGTGNDRLVGGGGDDKILGHTGADTFDGGVGDDRLFGGNDTARDVFQMGTADGLNGSDQVFSFGAEDVIEFEGTATVTDIRLVGGNTVVDYTNIGGGNSGGTFTIIGVEPMEISVDQFTQSGPGDVFFDDNWTLADGFVTGA